MLKFLILAGKRIISSFAYQTGYKLKRTVKPLFLNFSVTYICNSRCIMCGIWKKYSLAPERELSAAEIESFVKSNQYFLSSLKSIGFTGGEPFLRPDFKDIIKAVHCLLPAVDLGAQTNGLLPELVKEKLKEILSFCPGFKIAVSLDGVGAVHDAVRGVSGAYDKAVQTIHYAKELGISGITCGMTLTGKNFDRIEETAKKVQELGCEFSCFMPEESKYFGNSGSDKLSRQQIDMIAGQLSNFEYHYFMDNLRRQLVGQSKRTLPCYSGYTSYVIDPYGDLYPCILSGDSFGNIRESRLKELLSSQKAWDIRKKINSCSCWCQCEVSTSAMVWPFDAIRWFLKSKKKNKIIRVLNRKNLIRRL